MVIISCYNIFSNIYQKNNDNFLTNYDNYNNNRIYDYNNILEDPINYNN